MLVILFGAALLYDDGVITPAISVISAVEGLKALSPLPDKSLIAMVPVNIRFKDDPGGSGNAIGAILATLGTDIREPKQRLETIVATTRRAKEQLEGMSKNAILQYSAIAMTPMMPAFNVVVLAAPAWRARLREEAARGALARRARGVALEPAAPSSRSACEPAPGVDHRR